MFPGEVRFYIIMVGLNVLLRKVHAETRVCLPEMNTFSHTNIADVFGFVKRISQLECIR